MPFCPNCRDEFQDWVKECPDCKLPLVPKLGPKPERVKPPPPPERNLVTITTFYYPTEAHLAAAKLASEGIWSFVADEYIVTNNWIFTNAVGGVKLQVADADVEDAGMVLRSLRQKQNDTEDVVAETEKCPACSSTRVQYVSFNMPLIFAVWLISYFLIPLHYGGGFTLPFFKRRWKCKDCGHQWKVLN